MAANNHQESPKTYNIRVQPESDELEKFNYVYIGDEKGDKKGDEKDFPLLLQYFLNDDHFVKATDDSTKEKIKKDGHPIKLMLHSADEILSGQRKKDDGNLPFGQDNLVNTSSNTKTPKEPIIHISLSDIFVDTLFGVSPLPKDVPRYYMIMDNSVWNYLVPMCDTYYIHNLPEYSQLKSVPNKRFTPQDNFIQAVQSICRNYKKGLYYLMVAKEYADLNARIVGQDYLSGAHASGVSPFIFHSEGSIKQMIRREFRGDTKNGNPNQAGGKFCLGSPMERILNHKWRILLLDDKASTPMETDDNEPKTLKEQSNTQKPWNSKCNIIKELLKQQLALEDGQVVCRACDEEIANSPHPPKNAVIVIEYAQSLEVAKKALQHRQYDLLLLDYLLNEATGSINYGYQLLEDIYNDQELCRNKKSGENDCKYVYIRPDKHHRLYCMFISAYSSAVNDRLLSECLNQSEKYWYINIGACPTNTPMLFLYNLLKLMDKHLDDSGMPALTTEGILDLMSKIFCNNDKKVRLHSSEFYHEVLELQHHYRGILSAVSNYDKEQPYNTTGSVLMSDFIQNNANLGGLLEHMGQLVHLSAYGTIRQWAEMWEEYVFFRSQFDEQCSKDKRNLTSEDKEKIATLYHNIEEHISNLKNTFK